MSIARSDRGARSTKATARAGDVVVKQVRTHVAVVGYGYWGSKHVRVLSTMPDVAVSVVDRDPERIEDARSHYPYLESVDTDLDAVLDRVDAVLVATPPGSHSGVALHALNAGKHVLVEKPLATSVADARAHGVRRGRQRRAADGGSHLRVQPCRPPAARDHPFGHSRPRAVHRLGSAEPGLVPARRERHLGPGAARHLDRVVPPRRAADRDVGLGPAQRGTVARGRRLPAPGLPRDARLRARQLAEPEQGPPHHGRRRTQDGRLRRHVGQRADPDLRHRGRPRRDRQPARRPRDAGELPHRRHHLAVRPVPRTADGAGPRLRRVRAGGDPVADPGRARARHRARPRRDRRRARHRPDRSCADAARAFSRVCERRHDRVGAGGPLPRPGPAARRPP